MFTCRHSAPVLMFEAQEGSPPQVTRSLFFKAPGHQVTFFHEKIKTTQVTGRFFKLSRSRGRPQNGPRSQVAKNPSWASCLTPLQISVRKKTAIAEISKATEMSGNSVEFGMSGNYLSVVWVRLNILQNAHLASHLASRSCLTYYTEHQYKILTWQLYQSSQQHMLRWRWPTTMRTIH